MALGDVSTTNATARFTEAVPLSLSSMAHTVIPLEDGVLDGLKTIVHHTLWSSLSYARAAFGQNYSPADLCTTPGAWKAQASDFPIPPQLQARHGFKHCYERNAVIYLNERAASSVTKQQQQAGESSSGSSERWTDEPRALAKITLLYAATGELSQEELEIASYQDYDEGVAAAAKKQAKKAKKASKKRSAAEISSEDPTATKNEEDDDDNAPPPPPKHVILCRATTEYRSLPATGNTAAKKAEELSMLSFGGSLVDDDVKYGALAGLYDDNAKYILEVLGVRGKKYRLDLMDATLSDGTVPDLPSRSTALGGTATVLSESRRRRGFSRGATAVAAPIPHDPFVKTLCVTVSDHEPIGSVSSDSSAEAKASAKHPSPDGDATMDETENENDEEKKSSNGGSNSNPQFTLTRMQLSLEGDLRKIHLLDATDLPAPNYYPFQIQTAFLGLRTPSASKDAIVTSTPSGHRLLLNPSEAGKIYIHGRFVTTWGKDPRIGGAMNSTALFGMDLHSVPYFHGRIVDYDKLMIAYATLWTEILTDARLVSKNIGGRLLSRLITGRDPFVERDDDDEDSDEDSDDEEEEEPRVNTDLCSLESQVMASSRCDPVGISAKALATKFQNEYGPEGYPCLAHELEWVKDRLPGKVPVAVPQRLIDVLRRGGFFDVKRTSEEIWYSESRPAAPGWEETLVERTCALLEDAGCTDVKPASIVFGPIPIEDPVRKKALVRLHRLLRQYHVHEEFLGLDPAELARGDRGTVDDTEEEEPSAPEDPERTEALALVLGMHIAREHPDGTIPMRYMLKHMVASKR